MKKLSVFIICFICISFSMSAKSFMNPGTTDTAGQIAAKNPSTVAYFDFSPKLYDFHVFGFTNNIVQNANMSFTSKADIVLVHEPQNEAGIFNSENDTLYFSYTFKGTKSYQVELIGADLTRMDGSKNQPLFITETTVTYPSGYQAADNTTKRQGMGPTDTYNSLVVLPLTNDASIIQNFGNYGSLELSIKATYAEVDAKGNIKLTPNVKPISAGYSGTFQLNITSI